jgi:RIO kinase 1
MPRSSPRPPYGPVPYRRSAPGLGSAARRALAREEDRAEMLIPESLRALLDDGSIQEVVRQLKSGKEASVFVVVADGQTVAAKVYKRLEQRNFRARQDYVEGRQAGGSREQRAMDKGSRFGRKKSEEAWQDAEAAAMRRLHAAGVRVPRALANSDGVLLMDLVRGRDGEPAPQIAAARYDRDQALRMHRAIMQQVAAMLCAGLVHADLSEFNILAAADGPMIIDLPQAVDAARNNNAKRMLVRDVANVTRFFARFAPELRRTDYGNEMWLLNEHQALRPDTPLTGKFQAARGAVDAQLVLRAIDDAKREAAKREEIRQFREQKRRTP